VEPYEIQEGRERDLPETPPARGPAAQCLLEELASSQRLLAAVHDENERLLALVAHLRAENDLLRSHSAEVRECNTRLQAQMEALVRHERDLITAAVRVLNWSRGQRRAANSSGDAASHPP
jgi:hypothetical protein